MSDKTFQVGRIDLGPTEPRRITQTEQRMIDAALRQSVRVVPDPEVERLRGRIRLLRAVVQEAIEWDSHDDEGVPAVWLEAAECALKETA